MGNGINPRRNVMPDPQIDEMAAHKHFSVACFNSTWELLEKKDRTQGEDEEMLMRAMASAWHWTRRPDVAPTQLSVAYWLISRVHAVLERGDEARRYGELALAAAKREGVAPFYLAYAEEALARAEVAAGRAGESERHAAEARRIAERITDAESKSMLLSDLDSLT
jgi:hypothetical protein